MTDASLPVLAGSASTVLFVASTLPMLVKAIRTKDLGSYSVGNLVLANVGNLVHAIRLQPAAGADLGLAQLLPGDQLRDAGHVAGLPTP